MKRKPIPKKLRDALLNEYSHHCAVCGGDQPQIHHIDRDPAHNELENLLPLCPNCHLRDQHNPTQEIAIQKLRLFRRFKNPSILKPQFHPIYMRQSFLETVEPGDESTEELEAQATELIEFIAALEIGGFYAKRLTELIGPPPRAFVISLGPAPDPGYERHLHAARHEYRNQLIANRDYAQALLVELLRYQSWANA